MKTFLDENFLLAGKYSRRLFHGYAKDQPIYDYHNHLIPGQIAMDARYSNITEVWLGGDHYKWRIMRSLGADENLVSGNGDPKDKFSLYVKAVSKAIGNPLYHWSHMELRRYFGIDLILCPENTNKIWEQANEKLPELSVRKILSMSNVHTLCTTDSPVDNLEHHKRLMADPSLRVAVRPSFRPDPVLRIGSEGFRTFIDELSKASGVEINGIDRLKQALINRMDYFGAAGCVVADHALDEICYADAMEHEADQLLKARLSGSRLDKKSIIEYQSVILRFLASEYRKRNWVMQLHIGALRNVNKSMLLKLGPDTGYDAVHDIPVAAALAGLMDAIERDGGLPKTVLFCLNPKDNYALLTIGGCFAGAGTAGKIQFGPAWWFNDHIDGMTKQLADLAAVGVLGTFIGMLTDSRSFLSFPRHEYFRRILCSYIGDKVENGELPWDEKWLGGIVEDICFHNARAYFEHKGLIDKHY
jgi:glucuronate isomerase